VSAAPASATVSRLVVQSPPFPHVAATPAVVSRDGARLAVRPMRRSDGPALEAAVEALSARSRYQRFLAPKPRLTRRDVATLTDVDHHAREALVAVEPGGGPWVAVARYATFAGDPLTADVAVTVADAWQGQGVGSALLALLIERAAQEGLMRLRATTLAGNLAAIRLLRRHGFEVVGQEGDAVELARDVSRPLARRSTGSLL
jgi:RimJ/RimL family protein N-acetyltransferase